jgi:hypothetical protein
MQAVGSWLELLGAVITGAGLFHAWNRASGRFTAWRNTMQLRLADLNAFLASGGMTFEGAAEDLAVQVGLTAAGEVTRSGTAEERLLTVEKKVEDLEDCLTKSLSSIGKIDNGIATELGRFESLANVIAVRDIYWALAGVAVGAVGIAVGMCA